MDLQEVFSAWAADAPGAINSSGLGGGGGCPLKLGAPAAAGGGEPPLLLAAGGGPPRAGGALLGGGGGAPRTSSGFMMTADCSAVGTLAPRAPDPARAPRAAVAAATNDNAATAAPFCFLPGSAGAGTSGGARSPESEATRLAVDTSHNNNNNNSNSTNDGGGGGGGGGCQQLHLLLPPVPVRAPTASSPEASAAAAAAAAAAAPAPPSVSYDFATVYALLGSLFDPACAGIDHAAALAQMPRGEREVAGVWLRSVAAHLRDPAAMAGHAAALTEAALMDRAASARFQQE